MKVWILAAAVATGVAATAMPTWAEDAPTAKAGAVEVKIALTDCPKVVQDTINKVAAGGTVGKVEKETENGKTTYEAKVTVGGKKTEVTVAEDGTLISSKAVDGDKEDGEKEDKD